jgi:hypothetical protein
VLNIPNHDKPSLHTGAFTDHIGERLHLGQDGLFVSLIEKTGQHADTHPFLQQSGCGFTQAEPAGQNQGECCQAHPSEAPAEPPAPSRR